MDKNGDGSINLEELKQGMQDFSSSEEVINLMKSADLDHSGAINYTEFIAATMDA